MTERRLTKVITERELIERMTPEDMEKALELIRFLATVDGSISTSDAGTLIASAEPVLERLKNDSLELQTRLAERRETRRKFLARVRNYGLTTAGLLVAGGGVYACYDVAFGGSAQRRQRENDRRLEETNTLGEKPSSVSFSGWTIRYAQGEDGKFVPTSIVSDPLEPDTWIRFPSNKLNQLEETGVVIKDHIRTTDGEPVGKLAIVTRYRRSTTSSSSMEATIGEEWVLRDQKSGATNPLVIFENEGTGQKYYLSITRSRPTESQKAVFQLRAFQVQAK